jgi:NADPH:quinone reductase-like Zn-dependent oxidoreductase
MSFLFHSYVPYCNSRFHIQTGHCDYFQEPPRFPYIPGEDISGTVVEADPSSRFKVGDTVTAEFELPRPFNGLAEFISVNERLVEIASTSIPLLEVSIICNLIVLY